jgi:hypothetical protein
MAKVWKITAYEEHMKGGRPQKQYFIVAMSDQFAAMSALRKRPTLRDADLTVVGEASDVEWLDVNDGEIFCVVPMFMTRSDPAQLAKLIIDNASGEVEDRPSKRPPKSTGRQTKTIASKQSRRRKSR